MKKTTFALALAAVGLLAVPAAFAQDGATAQQGGYISANAGYGQVKKTQAYKKGKVFGGIKAGYRFAINPETALGVEVGYQTLGRINARDEALVASTLTKKQARSKLHGFTAGLDLRYNIKPSWYADLRGGAFFAKGEGLTDDATAPTYQKFKKTKYYAGVGVGYNIDSKWSVGVNYDYYPAKGKGVNLTTNAYTVSAEYRF